MITWTCVFRTLCSLCLLVGIECIKSEKVDKCKNSAWPRKKQEEKEEYFFYDLGTAGKGRH